MTWMPLKWFVTRVIIAVAMVTCILDQTYVLWVTMEVSITSAPPTVHQLHACWKYTMWRWKLDGAVVLDWTRSYRAGASQREKSAHWADDGKYSLSQIGISQPWNTTVYNVFVIVSVSAEGKIKSRLRFILTHKVEAGIWATVILFPCKIGDGHDWTLGNKQVCCTLNSRSGRTLKILDTNMFNQM